MTAASLVRDLIAFSVQIALVGFAVAVLITCLRVPAPARYTCLRLALAAALMLPWLLRAPALPQPMAQTLERLRAPFAPVTADPVPWTSAATPTAPGAATSSLPVIPWTAIFLGVLLLGVVVRGIWLAIGLRRLRRLRRQATAIDVPEYEQVQRRLGTRATIAQVAGLTQPATFGLRRPVVLLPETLAAAPPTLQRAVVTHELFHVRRRDWLSVLVEEIVRTVFWFHPAIFWLTSTIQLAREEIVDELSVRLTGDRRTYVQALMAFADSGGLRQASAFAHRRQLFHRILSVSKEKVMSRSRVAMSGALLIAAVFTSGWYASSLFPIVAAPADMPALATGLTVQPLRDSTERVVLAGAGPEAAAGAQASAGTKPQEPRQVTPENPIPRRTRGVAPMWPSQFAREQFYVVVSARVTLDRNGAVTTVAGDGCSVSPRGNEGAVCRAFFDAADAAIRQWRYDRPVQAPLQFNVMMSFRPGTEPVVTQSASNWAGYVRETQDSLRAVAENTGGIAVTRAPNQSNEDFLKTRLGELTSKLRELERAHRLALERYTPSHPEVINLYQELAQLNADLARMQEQLARNRVAEQTVREGADGRRESEDVVRARLREAEAVLQEARRNTERVEEQAVLDARRRELEANVRAVEAAFANQQLNAGAVTTNVGPPQAAGAAVTPLRAPSGRTPVRVGGSVAAPRVLESFKPEYSPEAMGARVEGTVVVEALIDEEGRVPDVRVIRSIPLLDRSAVDAAKRWRFTPTVVNGQPTPVVVQLELNFALRR